MISKTKDGDSSPLEYENSKNCNMSAAERPILTTFSTMMRLGPPDTICQQNLKIQDGGSRNLEQEALLSQRDCATRLSVEILQLQNIAIVWHYLRDAMFSRFYTIPKCDRHTHTDRRTDRYTTTACTALSIASLRKKSTILHCTPSIITRQRASVDSKSLGRPRNVGY